MPRYDESEHKNTMLSSRPCGIWNIGNTCWMNSVMQCLARCETFITELKRLSIDTNREQLSSVILDLLMQIRENATESPCDPWNLFHRLCWVKDCKHFTKFEQQDARELLTRVLTHWKEGESRLKRISDTFEGQVLSTISCPKCKRFSKVWEPYQILSLALRQENPNNISPS